MYYLAETCLQQPRGPEPAPLLGGLTLEVLSVHTTSCSSIIYILFLPEREALRYDLECPL